MSKKKVLVTGADGFIGSHLTELLLAEGYSVRALSYYNSFNDWGWLEGIKPTWRWCAATCVTLISAAI